MSVGREFFISPKYLIETTELYCKKTKFFTKDGYFAKLRAQRFIYDVIIKCLGITDPALQHQFLKAAIKNVIQHKTIPETLAQQLYDDCFQYKKDKEQQVKYSSFGDFTKHQTAKLIAATKRQSAQQQKQIPKIRNQHILSQLSDLTLPRTLRPYFFRHCKLKANHNSQPIDITGRVLKDGWYMYVILPSKEIRFLPNYNDPTQELSYQKYRSHSQLSGGQSVRAAGCFKVENGKIIKLDGSSGHFKTSEMKYVQHANSIFVKKGIDMEGVQLAPAFLSKRATSFNRTFRKCYSTVRGLFFSPEIAEKRPSLDDIDDHWKGWIPSKF